VFLPLYFYKKNKNNVFLIAVRRLTHDVQRNTFCLLITMFIHMMIILISPVIFLT